jgi:hypothetical protein
MGMATPTSSCGIDDNTKFLHQPRVQCSLPLVAERHLDWPAVVWLNLESHHDQQVAKKSMQAVLLRMGGL